jgi:hypothetical protein
MASQITFFRKNPDHSFVELFDGVAQEVPRKDEIVIFARGYEIDGHAGIRYRVAEVAHCFISGYGYDDTMSTISHVEITLEELQ